MRDGSIEKPCAYCNATLKIRAPRRTVNVVCPSCRHVIDITQGEYGKILDPAPRVLTKQRLPIGARGRLDDIDWVVIGYLERRAISEEYLYDSVALEAYQWREYLLFNEQDGLRWLTEWQGHWSLLRAAPERVTSVSPAHMSVNPVVYEGEFYELFQRDRVRILEAVGEFDSQLNVSELVTMSDYVRAPEILCLDGDTWMLGEYVEHEVIERGFALEKELPTPHGVAPNQPSRFRPLSQGLGHQWAFFVALVVLIQSFVCVTADHRVVHTSSFTVDPSDPQHVDVTPSFEFGNGVDNLELTFASSLSNYWIQIEGDLINDATGEAVEFEKTMEYYSGEDIHGRWTEGSQRGSLLLSSIPAGRYHLNLSATSDMTTTRGKPNYQVDVRRQVITWSNFFWTLFGLSVWPLFVLWRRRAHEMARWEESNYSPFREKDT